MIIIFTFWPNRVPSLKMTDYRVRMYVALAGNFNGNSKDDNLKPDNTPAANTNELGDSWQVPDPRPE